MIDRPSIRWGILGTANIARASFLPALRAAGGIAYAVGGRDRQRTEHFARANGVEHARQGYESIIADDTIDAVYNPLPNTLHAPWTIAALQAGKAVLCEKPLAADLSEVERVVGAADTFAGLLWEAFVFPFREQTQRLQELIVSGTVGEVREIQASFHFNLGGGPDIRLDPELGGGALLDVGCYPVSFARLVLRSDAAAAQAAAVYTDRGVDIETAGLLLFPGGRRLVFSCGMRRAEDTFARVMGTEGEIRLTNPYHPGAEDTMEVLHPDGTLAEASTNNGEPSFTAAIRHIHRVLWGEESPRHLAQDDALGNAVALDLIARSARSGRREAV